MVPAAFCLYFMQARVYWVLIILGTQVIKKKRPVWPVFPDYLSVSYDYGFTHILTLLCMMLKNDQTYFKNFAVWSPQDLKYVWAFFNIINTRVNLCTSFKIIVNFRSNFFLGQLAIIFQTALYLQHSCPANNYLFKVNY